MLLLVDDQSEVRFMISLFLEEAGLEFREASSGEEALDLVNGEEYELIVLDQRMPPGLSGIEVATTLRERDSALPIVLYSAFLDADVEAQAGRLGVTTVEKGDPMRLVTLVRSIVGAN